MQARYYDPVIGRFYSNDPVDALGHMQRSNSIANGFNRYTYANNNPYKYVDPDGEFALQVAAFILGAVVGGVTESLANPTASKMDVFRAAMVGGVVATAGTIPGVGLKTAMAIGGAANGLGDAVNQVASGGEFDVAQSLTAVSTGIIGSGVGKGVAHIARPGNNLPSNSINQANHGMTASSSQRILAGSESLGTTNSAAGAREVLAGANYAAGANAGMEAAKTVQKKLNEE